MAKRDPNKTARNKMVASIKEKRRAIQERVFNELKNIEGGKYCNEASLNAFIGSKADEYLNLHEDVISTPMEYTSKWLSGLKRAAHESRASFSDPRHQRMFTLVTGKYPCFKQYLALFLQGSFLKHYEEHYKIKPKVAECEYWFGHNDDTYGFLVTPRFAGSQWENDKSEIRHFSHPYWTLSHLMQIGLCIMGENRMHSFSQLSDYLNFFRALVKRTKSAHQLAIADRYIDYVSGHGDALSIPVLIPELRYDPLKREHQHRLDFMVVNPWSLKKSGFELSPWSTHGKLSGANRKMSEYDRESQANFEAEMTKHKRYWRKYGIAYVTYTDTDLSDINQVWEEIKSHLEPSEEPQQLELSMLESLIADE